MVTMLKPVEAKTELEPRKAMNYTFGFKLHSKVDIDYGLIRDIETTTASLHDAPVALEQSQIFNLGHSQVDLSIEGEAVLRDKGYFGVTPKVDDFSMKRATAEHPLNDIDKLRNSLISKLRSPGERPYSVIKIVFRAGHVLVTTVQRVNVKIKMVFNVIAFNLCQLCTLKNAKVI